MVDELMGHPLLLLDFLWQSLVPFRPGGDGDPGGRGPCQHDRQHGHAGEASQEEKTHQIHDHSYNLSPGIESTGYTHEFGRWFGGLLTSAGGHIINCIARHISPKR
jgi:hypothetical protein